MKLSYCTKCGIISNGKCCGWDKKIPLDTYIDNLTEKITRLEYTIETMKDNIKEVE